MNHSRETIVNPVTGETLHILESTRDVFKFAYELEPHSEIAGEHIHPFQTQTILVTAGELLCRINGREHRLCAGDAATIPAGARHFQANLTDFTARAIEEYRPAGRIHSFFQVLFALARTGKTNRQGVPHPLIGAALMAEFKDTLRPSSLGFRLLFGLLAPISSLLGYRRTIRDYVARFEMADDKRAALSRSNQLNGSLNVS